MNTPENTYREDQGIMGALTGGAMIGVILLVVAFLCWEIFGGAQNSVVVKLYERFGYGEVAALEIQQEAQADFDRAIKLAVGEVEAVVGSYKTIYEGMRAVAEQAAQWEGEVVKLQARTLSDSSTVKRWGTNIADAACMIARANGDTYSPACDFGDDLRRENVAQYPDLLAENRVNYVGDVMAAYPDPYELMSDDFKRLRASLVSEEPSEDDTAL